MFEKTCKGFSIKCVDSVKYLDVSINKHLIRDIQYNS